MVARIKRVAPVQFGLVYGVVNAFMGLIFALLALPFWAVGIGGAAAAGNPAARMIGAGAGVLGLVLYPIVFFVFSFIGGVIFSLIYNLVAGWTGGVEVTLEQRTP